MKLTTAIATTIAATVTALLTGCGSDNVQTPGAYAEVNGLHMYYEVHGPATDQPPLVLLHGALSGIDTDFGQLIPELSKTRRVIAIEQQAHGRTADIDRPLRYEQMAEDTVALLHSIGVRRADIFGYSMGGGVALRIALTHPDLVRKQIIAAASLDVNGMKPGLMEGFAEIQPEMLHGTPFYNDYLANAPRPEDFPRLVAKVSEQDRNATPTFPVEAVRQITSPTLTMVGDADIIRPEHAVEMFRIFGGGAMGDTPAGLPNAQLAILPGTSHVTLVHRPELLLSIIPAFLDAPIKAAQ
ncbi:alpha/beta fold hydrolase [Nocardia nepalensis]|uniref:alpha/beta fold hydrolase n=1 Tax=Nocardia nepalensis TaxID=3375448 RepID=UPI003B679263